LNGINICSSTANQTAPVICEDQSGGAYVVWKDSRNGHIDLYAQHIYADGSFGYGATGTGIAVAANSAPPDYVSICPDGFGNAYVAWQDSRTSLAVSTRPDIWMNKLTFGGAAWGGNSGTSIISQALEQVTPKVVNDGSGGCFLVWTDKGLPAASIWGNRISSGGNLLWGNPGIQIFGVSAGSTNACRNPNIIRDGSQLCVSWEQVDNVNTAKGWNILANRVTSNGSVIWGTTTTAPEVSTDWVGDQINSIVFPDDSTDVAGIGGLLVVYENYLASHDVVITRLMSNGNDLRPPFPNQLYTVCQQAGDQTFPRAVKTGTSQVLIVWNDTRSNEGASTYSSIYAQRCDKTPSRLIGPASSSWGVPVSNRIGSNADQVTLISRTNGGIAVWRDSRNGNSDIYAQLIFSDGSLPIELSDFMLSARQGGNILISWQTASEKDNAGFEIERRLISDLSTSNNFEVVGSYRTNSSLLGKGSSNTVRDYSYVDRPGKSGVYEYRLVDYSLDGVRTVHDPKTIEVSELSASFAIGQNAPNPFSDKTIIPVTLASDAYITIRITDILGRVVAMPYTNSLISAGSHQLQIDANTLGGSGNYFCTVTLADPETGNILTTNRETIILSR
jgi:hypothetical protein